jgi:hypothetical protein
MNRLRHSATLLLITAFAVFQLLATAPLLHSAGCENLESLSQAKHQREAPAFRDGGGRTRGTDECPVCMVSGLSAILSPDLAVFSPLALQAVPLLPAGAAERSPSHRNLRGRAPPAA